MERHAAQATKPLLQIVVETHPRRLGAYRLFQAGCSLARGGSQCNEERGAALRHRLLLEQREDTGNGGGLARPRTAGDDRDSPEHRDRSSQGLEVSRVCASGAGREHPGQALGQQCLVDSVRRCGGQLEEIGRHLELVHPEPVQIQVRSREMQRTIVPDERAGTHGGQPGIRVRPGQGIDVGVRIRLAARGEPDRSKVDAHVTQTRCPGGKADPEPHEVIGDAAQRGQSVRDVDIGGSQHTGLVEFAQQPLRAQGQCGVKTVQLLGRHHG